MRDAERLYDRLVRIISLWEDKVITDYEFYSAIRRAGENLALPECKSGEIDPNTGLKTL